MLHSAGMGDMPALVEASMRPRLLALASIDEDAAATYRSALAASAGAFARGALAFALGDLLVRVGAGGTWVWSVGDAHHSAFATLAVGRFDGEGLAPVVYELAEAEEEHPGPWRWDLVRLLASLALLNPEQKGSAFTLVVGRTLDGYAQALSQGGEAGVDAQELPEALAELIARDGGALAAQRHLSAHLGGEGDDARLRLDGGATRDLSARAFFLPALSGLYGEPLHVVALDCVRLPEDPALPGRRRWRALVRERGLPRQERQRLLEIRERPAPALASLLPAVPFTPVAGPAMSASVVLGHDPLQRLLHGPARSYSVRSFCHCRRRLDPATLGEAELLRLARLWGLLLGNAHLRGLKVLRVDIEARARAITQELGEARKDMARLSWEHAAMLEKGYAAFRKLVKAGSI
jgi:hypothetical protein